ncbi:putative MarR family transcriptional regulator [Streptomyces scabiei 87.22]|uniref:Putative MarR family transcriptional regulator n=1 Tax=Streptomyces scabiei (strain 87.22) TaxID=680198 RepID=C9Z1R1_STRSW|nr:putative MarR family transcriptional regulator [Streptomyces scabiei 87.22]
MTDPPTSAPTIRGAPVPGQRSITEAEKLAAAKLGDFPIRRDQMAAVANIYRAASAVRQHLENSVLRPSDLTWTAFVVLWVVWVWGESETRHVAEEAGISKGTLTGVARTLESRGLVRRAAHPTDGRLVLLALTDKGEELMRRVFPAFNEEEAFVTGQLSDTECRSLAEGLRSVVLQVEEHGEERRRTLLNGAEPAPRRSGRRPKA